MRRRALPPILAGALLLCGASSRLEASSAAGAGAPAAFTEEKLAVPLLGKVTVYRPQPVENTRGVVLFVSGDGGWNLGVVEMARRIAPRAIVAGLSMPAWRKVAERKAGACWYPAGELESIAQAVQKSCKLPRYLPPILIGYSSGATLVYAALAQAPPESFAGAVSLGFCPDLEVARSVCGHRGWKPSYDDRKRRSLLPALTDLAPAPSGEAKADKVCDAASTSKFVGEIPRARLVMLPKVGHGFSVPRNWSAAFDDAVGHLLAISAAFDTAPDVARHVVRSGTPEKTEAALAESGLPLRVEWPDGARQAIVFVSGDGGWAEIDQQIAAGLAGADVVLTTGGANLSFSTTAHVIRAIPAETRVFAGGYSFGAEVMAASLATGDWDRAGPLSRIEALALVAPGAFAAFEVSPLDWLRASGPPSDYPVREALARSTGPAVLCLRPSDDSDSGCPDEPTGNVRRAVLPGGHHFGGDFAGITARILEFMRSARPEAAQP